MGEDHAPNWLAFLRACGAMEAFMRSTSELHDANGVAAFLLLDRLFPRSVLYSLNLADTCLFEIQPSSQRIASADLARQSLARARGRLDFIDSSRLLEQLPELLEMLEETCSKVNESITDRFFRHEDAVSWSARGGL